MFNYEKWYSKINEEDKKLPPECLCPAAWNESRKQTAKEIIQYIIDQGTIGVSKVDDVLYYIVDDDLNILRDKYGIERG